MPAFVHGKADEKKWAKGKRAAGHAGLKPDGNYWAMANAFFHGKIKRKKKGGSKARFDAMSPSEKHDAIKRYRKKRRGR